VCPAYILTPNFHSFPLTLAFSYAAFELLHVCIAPESHYLLTYELAPHDLSDFPSDTTPYITTSMEARKSRVFARREIEDQIANGRAIVIVDSKVLKVDAWLPYHPGGAKAIRHMVGRDATDEVQR
jgi:cytochrome b involved in lipid metabolism